MVRISRMQKLFVGFLILVLISIFGRRLSAQEEKDSSTTLSVAAASFVPVGIASGIFILNYEAFWKYADQVPFWISPDPPYAMHIDKFAHGYLSALGSTGIRDGYELAGVSEKTSTWVGAGISFGLGVLIEMEDARHGNDPQYGFSPGDAFGDLVGSALPVLQYYFPAFRRVQPKIFLWPSDAYKAGAYKTIADDYESQYFWLSFDVHDITSTPAWLNFGVGFSAENLLQVRFLPFRANTIPYTDVYIGPDINLKGIPIEGSFWKTFTDVVSWIRIPLPTLQVYPRVKVWGLR
ncbi:MAG: hypothetical protein ACHQM6_08365 [Candidatus Kapaibacterium sp.]